MKRKLARFLFHALGVAGLGSAVFLQLLMLLTIGAEGYFKAYEHNPVILGAELSLSFFTVIYYVYVSVRAYREL
jgi:hypothetical protein